LPSSSASIISDYFEKERRATAFALFGMGLSLGVMIGPALAGTISAHFGWRRVLNPVACESSCPQEQADTPR